MFFLLIESPQRKDILNIPPSAIRFFVFNFIIHHKFYKCNNYFRFAGLVYRLWSGWLLLYFNEARWCFVKTKADFIANKAKLI